MLRLSVGFDHTKTDPNYSSSPFTLRKQTNGSFLASKVTRWQIYACAGIPDIAMLLTCTGDHTEAQCVSYVRLVVYVDIAAQPILHSLTALSLFLPRAAVAADFYIQLSPCSLKLSPVLRTPTCALPTAWKRARLPFLYCSHWGLLLKKIAQLQPRPLPINPIHQQCWSYFANNSFITSKHPNLIFSHSHLFNLSQVGHHGQ